MAAKISAAVGIFLALHLLCLSNIGSACDTCHKPKHHNPTYGGPGTRSGAGTCPRDALKLGVCANVLRGLLHVIVGQPPKTPCCSLIQGLADVEAAACLCIAIRANLLGINLNVPLSLNLLLNYCGFRPPTEFRCA